MSFYCEVCTRRMQCTATRTLEDYVRRTYECTHCDSRLMTKEYKVRTTTAGMPVIEHKQEGFYAAGSE